MSGVWAWIPAVGPIRISTVVGAGVMFIVVSVVRHDPFAGVVAVVAWTAVFETIYHLVGIVGYHWPMANFIWGTAAVAGWVILAWRMNIRPEWRFSVVFVVALAIWIATGFHYNIAGQAQPINLHDEVLNEAAKTSLGLAYLAGSVRSIRIQKRTGPAMPTPSLVSLDS